MTLLSQKEHFDFPLFIKSLSKYKRILGEKQLFTFIPYLDKDVRLRNKKLMKNKTGDWQIIRFDYILRKIIKTVIRECENYNEDTYDIIWFYMLDSLMKLKQFQVKILNKLRTKLYLKVHENKDLDEDAKKSKKQEITQKYDEHIENINSFFKSRTSFIIENTLKYIEFESFLDHIVRHDASILFVEL